MNFPKCPICNLSKTKFIFSKVDYKFYKCLRCEFVFVYPRPSFSTLKAYYSKFDYNNEIFAEKRIRDDSKISLKFIMQNISGPIDLLDLGCGRGYFMDEARKMGIYVKGVDYSNLVVKYAKETLGLQVIKSDISIYNDNKLYNLIVLNQVIEHISSLKILLYKAKSLLVNGGYLYIATPNISSASSIVFKENFEHIIPPEHINYFNNKSLSNLLNKFGFKIVRCGTWGYPENMAGIVKELLYTGGRVERNNCSSRPVDSEPSKFNLKSFLFDNLFCNSTYRLLNYFNLGINLHLIAQKN